MNVHEPPRRARGIRLIDDAVRDARHALRGFTRAPLVAVTIVATVALGLGLVTGAFTLLNTFLFRADRVPDVHEMVALQRPPSDGRQRPFTREDLDALRRETTVFADAYAELARADVRVNGRTLAATFTSGNFFQVTGVNAATGRTLTPADDEPPGRAVVVLSDRGWDRMFARDPAILGRTVPINGVTFEVVGVMPAEFRGLSVVPPDMWAPLATAGSVRPAGRGRDADVEVGIIGRLKPGMSREMAQAGLAVWAAGRPDRRPGDGAALVALVPWQGTIQQPIEALIITAPLFFAFGLVLLIGCANVTNLLLARALARQREIGIRLSLGAARGRIVRQLLTESLLLALLAAAAGFAVSRVTLHALMNALMSSWPPEIGDLQVLVPDWDWRVGLFLLAGAVLSTIFFGLVPALQGTRIEPLRTMRGEVIRDGRPGRARDVLIAVQVGASALLLICAALFLRSAFAATTVDAGLRTTDTVTVAIANEQVRTAIVQAVSTEPSVAAVAAVWPGQFGDGRSASAAAAGTKAPVTYRFVSPEYFSVLDIAIVRGRAFASHERAPNLAVAIVSETTARALWPNADAVGQIVHLDPAATETPGVTAPVLGSRTVTVVGVARDVAGFRIAPLTKAVVYLPTNAAVPGTALVARVRGDSNVAREALLTRVLTIDPDISEVGALRSVTRMETYLLSVAFSLTVGLGGLALALTLSGLFSVLSYLVEQRTKEIGLRMALGATTADVARLVLSQSIRPVGGGLLLGGVAAAGLSALLLATPAAATVGEIVRVRDPIAYGVSALAITAACLAAAAIPAARAARLDPTRTLRQE